MGKMIKTVRMVDGQFRLILLTEEETRRVIVFAPLGFWRRRRKPLLEIGGPVPRPIIGPSARHDGLVARRSPL
jgi:hypothetical protein